MMAVPQPQNRIEDDVALIGGSRDDPFEERERLLRWIAKAFLRLAVDRGDVRPDCAQWDASGFVQVPDLPWNRIRPRLDHLAISDLLLHVRLAVAPVLGDPENLVERIALGGPPGSGDIPQAIPPTGF